MADATQRELSYRKRLIEIANRINSAPGIPEILVDLKDPMLDLVEAERVTLYALDTRNQELFSLFKVGQEVREIRVPKSFASIAGFTALSRKTANVKDAYDTDELARLHPSLRFDARWDKSAGFRTTQVLSTPIVFDKYLLGVLQLINKRGGTPFTARDEEAAEELARILGIAFYNQHRAARSNKPTKFGGLVDKGLISEADLEKAVSSARVNQIEVARVLLEELRIPKDEVLRALAQYYGCGFWAPGDSAMPEDLKRRVSSEFLQKYACAPFERRDSTVRVAVEDPHDLTRLDAIKAMNIAPRYEFVVGLRDDILTWVRSSFGETGPVQEEADLGRIILDLGAGEEDEVEAAEEEAAPEIDETDSGIVRLCNQIIIDAYNRGASDIHVEPYGKRAPTVVRLRVDGECEKYIEVPAPHRNALVQRFKIMSKLDIAERRKPQDGKIRFRGPMGTIELRVATVPTAGGNEDVVMRILAASKPLPLDRMGFSERNLREFEAILEKPYGIALVVGPTGSGKTTTLHSALGHINKVETKIWTAEDPVEITQPGLRQVQVHPKIGFTFAAAMRSFLRADPDVIMVGEMRDHETASIGVEASLTGHLVFSTLHTNSAPETIVRLLDMDIDPFNFADALLGIMAQRLVRTLCTCKEEYAPSQEEFAELMQAYGLEEWSHLGVSYSQSFRLHRPRGCAKCGDSGYKGRMGIHELLVGSDEVKRLVQKRSPVRELRGQAVAEGMTTLLQDGIQKVLQGHTDFKQVRAVCMK
ncbi:MAG: GspE/PulE family protein [Acidobacteria bacterium]|nr:GspE/PulE family protein [Acidobacteriota bacterium]